MTKKTRISGYKALEEAYDAQDHEPLFHALSVEISKEKLRHALTHRSFAHEYEPIPDNERLEFLGDAVLGLAVAARLYEQYPDRTESEISKMRASIVNRYSLADAARGIDLGKYIFLGKGEHMTHAQNTDSILADTTEAILGAIYLEHGYQEAQRVVLHLFQKKIDKVSSKAMFMDWKTALAERVAAYKLDMPEYSVTSEGPQHDQVFTAVITLEPYFLGRGQGKNKKTAEQRAARAAYTTIGKGLDKAPNRENGATAEDAFEWSADE